MWKYKSETDVKGVVVMSKQVPGINGKGLKFEWHLTFFNEQILQVKTDSKFIIAIVSREKIKTISDHFSFHSLAR